MTRRAIAWALAALLLAGCGKERIPPPSAPAPALQGPTDAIPAELDVAIRIDLGRIRSVLGADAFERLRQRAVADAASADSGTERLLTDALARADAVWIALRPAQRAELTDTVTVLKGDFAKLDPRAYESNPRWGPALDLGGGWRRYDREAPPLRSAPARIYARTDDVLVLVSVAAVDSVERRLEEGVDDSHLEPAERGVLSLEARTGAVRGWLSERWPLLGRLAGQGDRLRFGADLDSRGLSAELELELESESAARQTADALAELARALGGAGGLEAKVLAGLRIEGVGNRVVARLVLPPEVLAEVLTDSPPRAERAPAGP